MLAKLYQCCLGLTLILFISFCGDSKIKTPIAQIHSYVSKNIDSLDYWLTSDFIKLVETQDSQAIRKSFFEGRRRYKKVEFAIEYFFPNAARSMNGPALPEIEPEEHTVIEPGGFQVIEEFLFPVFDTSQQKELIRETLRLKSLIIRTRQLWPDLQFRDDQVFDALRQECFRIITLGISGFDSPIAFKGIDEVPVSLQSVSEIISCYTRNAKEVPKIIAQLDAATKYAQTNTDFNSFNRMDFIKLYINPATTTLLEVQNTLGIKVLTNVYALRGDLKTLFDSAAFNVNFFSPDANSHISPAKIALGKKLFYDPVLSENNRISCASCHKPELAFTDGLAKSAALGGSGFLGRNTPTILNAAIQKSQFYDMRSAYLEDQVRDVVSNKDEIHGSLESSVFKLRSSDSYLRFFSSAFSDVHDTIDERKIQVALASYVRSQTSFNARFDEYMRGLTTAMNAEEIKGFNLFMGKAKCGICHFMPTFNGTVPPAFTFTESEVIGVPGSAEEKQLDTDRGRYAIHKIVNYEFAFKTPGLRNVSLTAPYMHNGIYQTLEEVIEFYNKGGGIGLGFDLPYQTLPSDKLDLDSVEKKAIVAFLNTLTDTSGINK